MRLDASTLAPTTGLAVWPDVSGRGNQALQSTPSNRPSVAQNVRFCSSAVRFGGNFVTVTNSVDLNPFNQVARWCTWCWACGRHVVQFTPHVVAWMMRGAVQSYSWAMVTREAVGITEGHAMAKPDSIYAGV
jgi:hypothetical protein